MTSPVLTDIRLELSGVDTNRVYPRDIPDLFEGGQLVLAGRYRQSGRTTIRITGRVGDERRTYEFPADLARSYSGDGHDFVERLWAVRRVGDLIDQIDMSGQSRELVDELVSLSLRYGLMTPYTSFLADENVPLHARVEHRHRATRELDSLSEASGHAGVAQRDLKQMYLQADKPSAPGVNGAFPASEALAAGGAGNQADSQAHTRLSRSAAQQGQAARGQPMAGMGGMAGGQRFGNARRPQQGHGQSGPVVAYQFPWREGKDQGGAQGKVRQIGTKTFYFKNGRWVDSSVKPEDDAKAEKVVQFSEDYFRLARSQKAEYNQYLSQDEPVTVRLDGKVYHIDPAPKDAAR
jgi:Ca-activated chloride channel family protein